jgi:hypothetical protein
MRNAMFAPNSRYHALATATHTTPDGRTVVHLRRRFLPQGDDLPLLVEVTPTASDRLDHIAARTLGDPTQFWRVCDANNALNPAALVAPGHPLRVPTPTVEVPR